MQFSKTYMWMEDGENSGYLLGQYSLMAKIQKVLHRRILCHGLILCIQPLGCGSIYML